jgi:hypothetical protein
MVIRIAGLLLQSNYVTYAMYLGYIRNYNRSTANFYMESKRIIFVADVLFLFLMICKNHCKNFFNLKNLL